MKVLLTGATGFVGSALTRRLESAGHAVLPVSRRPGARYDWSDDGLSGASVKPMPWFIWRGKTSSTNAGPAGRSETWSSSRVDATRRLAALVASVGLPASSARRRLATTARASGAIRRGRAGRNRVPRRPVPQLGSSHGRGDGRRRPDRNRAPGRRAGPRRRRAGEDAAALQARHRRPVGQRAAVGPWIHLDDLTSLFEFLLTRPESMWRVQRDGACARDDDAAGARARPCASSSRAVCPCRADAAAGARRSGGRAARRAVRRDKAGDRSGLQVQVHRRRGGAA